MKWEISLAEIHQAVGGKVLTQINKTFSGVGTDSRKPLEGKLFIPLVGEHFDAHDFCEQAVLSGAAGVLVHKDIAVDSVVFKKASVIQVKDTLKALQDLAHFWRKKMPARIGAITGTNGKTTTKEFARTVLSVQHTVHASEKSFNNHWGVPLTLLGLDPADAFGIIEVGMNHPGELTHLNSIIEPDIVLVTSVGRGHLEGLGSVEGVAQAKEELYLSAPDSAVRIFNLDNSHTFKMYEKARSRYSADRILTFSGDLKNACHPQVSFQVTEQTFRHVKIVGHIRGHKGSALVPVFGHHNVDNLMAASALALSFDMKPADIWESLGQCQTGWGRSQWVALESGSRVLFDGYNANPESMKSIITTLSQIRSTAALSKNDSWMGVFGEMLELGAHSKTQHEILGEQLAQLPWELLWIVGPSHAEVVKGLKSKGFKNNLLISNAYEQTLARQLKAMLQPNRSFIVVVKGSHGMHLEKVVSQLDPLDFSLQP